tara:strand:+ start:1060 stop:1791 length:732 start_codon:yes stop_codon:yes gene_type:complete
MKNIALIPARSGSKGVKDKNIKILEGFPLLAYSIAAAKMTQGIDRVIVTTDSKKYADIAKKYGAETPFLRPKLISKNKSSDLEFFEHCIEWLIVNENYVPDNIIHLRPTTPIRDPELVSEAINILSLNKNATSLRSGHKAPESPFKWFLKDENNFFKGLKEGLTPDMVNMPRQGFPDVFIPDGYVDIIKPNVIKETGTLHGQNMLIFESPRSFEIDEKEDFDYINFLLKKQKEHSIINYLKSI